jgi:putative DNA primase/helicase
MTTLQDVALQIRLAVGEEPPEVVADGKRRYFGHKKKSWYRLREMTTRGGSRVVVGRFGNYKQGIDEKVDVDWKGISAEERQHLQAQREASAAREAAERQRRAAWAKMSAAELWRNGSPTGTSAYLQRKGVEGEACRYLADGSIIIPLLRYDLPKAQALQACQRIWPQQLIDPRTGEPDGDKRYTSGFQKDRACLRLGMVVVGEPLLVCEGYATGLSIRMATDRKLPVFVALDAHNLGLVCEMLLELHPEAWLLICADDDWQTEGNPGRAAAKKAAKQLGRCDIVWPVFPPGQRGKKDTDFNDLHLRAGLNAVQRQLGRALSAMRRVRLAA